MTYTLYYQLGIYFCIAGILTGIISYLLRRRLRHPIIGCWLESIAIQATILSAILVSVLYYWRKHGGEPVALTISFRAWIVISMLVILQSSISLIRVYTIYRRFKRYVYRSLGSMDMSDYLNMFHAVYQKEMRSFDQMYRDIFHDLSYELSKQIDHL